MKRRLLNLLTALSLLLCLAACAMWARGRFVEDLWLRTTPVPGPGDNAGESGFFDRDHDHDYVTSGHGRLVVGRDRWTTRGRKWDPFPLRHVSPPPWRHQARPPGNPYRHVEASVCPPWLPVRPERRSDPFRSFVCETGRVEVHYWLVAVLAAPLPVAAVRTRLLGWRRRRRGARGLCPRCGYDLRATPGRCPECGTDASVSPSA